MCGRRHQSDSISLREPFRKFWNTKLCDASLSAGEFTLGQLVAAGFSPIMAFSVFDWVHKEPRLGAHRVRLQLWRQSHLCHPGIYTCICRTRPAGH